MKYRIEVSEEQLRVIGLAVDEYMRLRMGQFDAFAEELALDGVADRFARPDLQGARIVQNWSGPHNFWVSCLSSNGKM